ncbi:MAG: hypothetical protein WC554_15130 [Clostridia bacterium]|jgi:hypothetical protein
MIPNCDYCRDCSRYNATSKIDGHCCVKNEWRGYGEIGCVQFEMSGKKMNEEIRIARKKLGLLEQEKNRLAGQKTLFESRL